MYKEQALFHNCANLDVPYKICHTWTRFKGRVTVTVVSTCRVGAQTKFRARLSFKTIPVFLIPHRRSNRIQDHDPSLNWHKYSKQGRLQKKKREKRSRKRKRLQKGHECHYSTISTQNWNRPKRMQVQTPLNMNLTNAMTKAVLATAHENRVARKNSQWQSSLLRCTVDKQRQHNVWNRFRQIYKI